MDRKGVREKYTERKNEIMNRRRHRKTEENETKKCGK